MGADLGTKTLRVDRLEKLRIGLALLSTGRFGGVCVCSAETGQGQHS